MINSFQSKIYIYYSLIIVAIVAILVSGFYYYLSSMLSKNAKTSIFDNANNVSLLLDGIIKEMDTVSTQVLFNRDIQEILAEANEYTDSNNFFNISLEKKSKMQSILSSINSPKVITRRICVLSNNMDSVFVGSVSEDIDGKSIKLDSLPWIQTAKKKTGKMLLIPPHEDQWLKTSNQSSLVFSLTRAIMATYTNYDLLGILEVQQPYSLIANICENKVNNGIRILITDNDNNLIYPLGMNKVDFKNHTFPLSNKSNNIFENSQDLICQVKSDYTGWTVTGYQSKGLFLKPIYFLQRVVILIGIAAILIFLIFAYFMNKRLTKPIRELRQSIKQISFDNFHLKTEPTNENNEINLLANTLESVIHELKISMNKVIEARIGEMNANFMALQAQMNPHFLYNTLMGINALAYERKNEEVIQSCTELAYMLRYSSSAKNGTVKLIEEIRYAESYLKLVKLRYEERINYVFSIEDNVDDIIIPKMVLQPLIENAIEHGFKNSRPPWELNIYTYCLENRWFIEVDDNGCGISNDQIMQIETKHKLFKCNLEQGVYENNLEIGGMALTNIFSRLYLLYRDQIVFSIHSELGKGTKIIIGGKI